MNPFLTKTLLWSLDGYGYRHIEAFVYDDSYFEKYVGYSHTPLGVELTTSRLAFLIENGVHRDDHVTDVGIGSGDFIASRPQTTGYDVNPKAKEWLKARDVYRVFNNCAETLTFWDSLEHIEDPSKWLHFAKRVFISTPIYQDQAHVLRSKHYRPDEHCWYFTHEGLINFMQRAGFELVAHDQRETDLGREDIGSYFFVKS